MIGRYILNERCMLLDVDFEIFIKSICLIRFTTVYYSGKIEIMVMTVQRVCIVSCSPLQWSNHRLSS